MAEEKHVILTGDRPTGKLHIGHYVGSLKNRVELQNTGKYDTFIMIADQQALTDNARDPEKSAVVSMKLLLIIWRLELIQRNQQFWFNHKSQH